MSITEQDVQKIAKLSRIRLSDDQLHHFQEELSAIFDWVEMLQEVNTDDVPLMASVSNVDLPFREDEVSDGDKLDDVLQNAPKSAYGCFVVPKVVE